jgi:glycosyltransferase involved in cell wall biosynthesis
VIRSGIDTEKLRKANGERVRKKYGLTKDYVLLQVGNIEINKRQVDSVKALQILSDRYKNIKLVFDGGGRREELIRLTEKLGVKDKVIFLRSSNDTELAEVYASCDVFLFPAQITWGLAVIEAMAAAKPVIVSNKCGASEIIQNNVNGIIINHAKPDELAKKAEMLFINPDIRNEIGKNASEYVNRNLSWEKFAERMENVFEKTILTFKKRT